MELMFTLQIFLWQGVMWKTLVFRKTFNKAVFCFVFSPIKNVIEMSFPIEFYLII